MKREVARKHRGLESKGTTQHWSAYHERWIQKFITAFEFYIQVAAAGHQAPIFTHVVFHSHVLFE